MRGHKGAAIHVRALSDALCDLGHQVSILTPRAGPPEGAALKARLTEVPTAGSPADATAGERELAAHAAAEEVFQAAKKLLVREHFDFIYERLSLWSDCGARLSLESGLPLIVEVNAPLRLEAARYRSLINSDLAERIEARMVRQAAALAVVSEPLRDYLTAQGAPAEKIHVIPNAVDEQVFHPAVDGEGLRARLGLQEKFVVGFVGTSRPWHDLEALLIAMARLGAAQRRALLRNGQPGQFHLLLVGDFPESIRKLIGVYALRDMTTIIGPIDNREVPACLAAMDVAVSPHPAMPDFYFSPLKLFEYLACGVATIAANLPPVAGVVNHGVNGLLYTPGDAEELAAQIAALGTDPFRREAIGLQAARYVLENHTWKTNACRITRLAGGESSPVAAPQAAVGLVRIWDDKMWRVLYGATRLDLVNEAFSRNLPAAERDGLGEATRWELLKYRSDRRYVLAYHAGPPPTDGAQKAVIGKIFHDKRGLEHFNLQKSLWEAGFTPASSDHISVARPLGYIPEMHMFVQEFAPGSPLDQFAGLPEFEQKVKVSAAVIAKLHDSPVYPRKIYPLTSELDNLAHWNAELCGLRPDLAPTFRKYLKRLQEVAEQLSPAVPTPVHRDFYYGQLLFSDPRVTLIDLDLLAWGDAAIDIANFAAHLQFLAIQRGDPHGFDSLAGLFTREYFHHRPAAADPLGIAFYEAATFFRLMYVAFARPQFSGHFEALFETCGQKTRQVLEKMIE